MRKGWARIIRIPAWDQAKPVHEQLSAHLRQLIGAGVMAAGVRLPAQRALARELGISRNTVISAYETLTSEGLLESRTGAGTFVALDRPHGRTGIRSVSAIADPAPEAPLHQGVPDLSLFPIRVWRRLQERRWRNLSPRALGYGDAAGWSGLRLILAQRVAAVRGVHCDPQQVHILPTTRAAVQLCCSALGVAGRQVLVEAPGYARASASLVAAGARLVPTPADDQGMMLVRGLAEAPDALLAYVTPSAHFPSGAALSPARRRALMQWARSANGWILEDDYESDFVFEGKGTPALAADGGADRVLYLSVLNHVLFPGAQLALLVVPEALVDRFTAARQAIDGAVNIPLQMVTADFIEGGFLAAHIRRCREVYGERRALLRGALAGRLGDALALAQQPIGLHVTAWLRDGLDGGDIRQAAAEMGMAIHETAQEAYAGQPRRGLYMGFAGFTPQVIERSVVELERIIRSRGKARRVA